jgi:hypothetical protein
MGKWPYKFYENQTSSLEAEIRGHRQNGIFIPICLKNGKYAKNTFSHLKKPLLCKKRKETWFPYA